MDAVVCDVCDVHRTIFVHFSSIVHGDISVFTLRRSAASISSEPSTYPAYCARACNTSGQILLVVDAADAFCESGEKEARASLAHFVDKLCGTDARLKILVTSDKAILERTDQYLSSSTEGVSDSVRGIDS